jgi:hypothetical protein
MSQTGHQLPRHLTERAPDRGEHCQAAKRTAADIEGHPEAAELSQPRRLRARKSMIDNPADCMRWDRLADAV